MFSSENPERSYYVTPLEALLKQWTHPENMIEKYLVKTYCFKQIMTSVIAIFLFVLNWIFFDWSNFYNQKELPQIKFLCNLPEAEINATCIIGGYPTYFYLFWANLSLLMCMILIPLVSIYLLYFKKMRHHSAYLINFLANSSSLYAKIDLEEQLRKKKEENEGDEVKVVPEVISEASDAVSDPDDL